MDFIFTFLYALLGVTAFFALKRKALQKNVTISKVAWLFFALAFIFLGMGASFVGLNYLNGHMRAGHMGILFFCIPTLLCAFLGLKLSHLFSHSE